MSIFGWFAVFGDVVSQAAQAFLPASVNILIPLYNEHGDYLGRDSSASRWLEGHDFFYLV